MPAHGAERRDRAPSEGRPRGAPPRRRRPPRRGNDGARSVESRHDQADHRGLVGSRSRRRSAGGGGPRNRAGELGRARRAQLRRAHQHAVGRGRAVVRGRRHHGLLQRPRGPRGGAGRPQGPLHRDVRRRDRALEHPRQHGAARQLGPRHRRRPAAARRRPRAVDHRRRQHHLLQVGPARDERAPERQRPLRHPQGRGRVDDARAAPLSHQHRRRQRALPRHHGRRRDAVLRLAARGRLRRVRHLVLAPGRRRRLAGPREPGPQHQHRGRGVPLLAGRQTAASTSPRPAPAARAAWTSGRPCRPARTAGDPP